MKKVMFAVSAMLGAACAMANVELGTPFSDNMVLQRDRSVPVWGRADAGEKVTVAFAGQTKTAIADATGAWKVMLDAMPASKENRVMKVSGPSLALRGAGTSAFATFFSLTFGAIAGWGRACRCQSS